MFSYEVQSCGLQIDKFRYLVNNCGPIIVIHQSVLKF